VTGFGIVFQLQQRWNTADGTTDVTAQDQLFS
jgi:hypothetical protein